MMKKICFVKIHTVFICIGEKNSKAKIKRVQFYSNLLIFWVREMSNYENNKN